MPNFNELSRLVLEYNNDNIFMERVEWKRKRDSILREFNYNANDKTITVNGHKYRVEFNRGKGFYYNGAIGIDLDKFRTGSTDSVKFGILHEVGHGYVNDDLHTLSKYVNKLQASDKLQYATSEDCSNIANKNERLVETFKSDNIPLLKDQEGLIERKKFNKQKNVMTLHKDLKETGHLTTREYEADRYAADHMGDEKVKKELKNMYPNRYIDRDKPGKSYSRKYSDIIKNYNRNKKDTFKDYNDVRRKYISEISELENKLKKDGLTDSEKSRLNRLKDYIGKNKEYYAKDLKRHKEFFNIKVNNLKERIQRDQKNKRLEREKNNKFDLPEPHKKDRDERIKMIDDTSKSGINTKAFTTNKDIPKEEDKNDYSFKKNIKGNAKRKIGAKTETN